MSKGEVREVIEVQQSQNSQMFSIVATSDQPEKRPCKYNRRNFSKEYQEILNLDRVSIVSYASANSVPVFWFLGECC